MNMLITTPFGQHNWATDAASSTSQRSRAEEYRVQAAQCQEIAGRSLDHLKHQYEELARQWLVLAAQAEKQR
jgi:hypothetical protein